MIRKKFNSASPVMALLILSVPPQSAHGDGCTNIYFREGATPTIYTSVDLGTSIEFPQPYSHYLANNPEVWRVDDATTGTPDNVIIISPKVNTKAIPGGSTTTLHVFGIDEPRTVYPFIVRQKASHPICYKIIDGVRRHRAAVATMARSNAMAEAQARDALDKYRTQIFSGYRWTEPEGWYGSTIDSVWDDGRMSWVRVRDNKGPMTVMAVVDDKKVVVQNSFDATKGLYRIAGVFPSFFLKAGEAELTITRGAPE